MGRSPCCDKVGLKKGPWTPEEDQKLLAYIEEHGHGSWRALPAKAGLQRCGKSCRLRWTNYLRPDIKRGKFSLQEEQTIIQLHALLGNRWSAIATHLPKRTDNEIKNYWNTHLKKRLAKMGIDPVTHKPKNDAFLSSNGQSRNAANLSHMAQWESARLEAEARLARQTKLRLNPLQNPLNSPEFASTTSTPLTKPVVVPSGPPRCLDILKAWGGGGVWSKSNEHAGTTSLTTSALSSVAGPIGGGGGLESPTSTLSYSDQNAPQISSSTAFIELVGNSSASCEDGITKEDGGEQDWRGFGSSTELPQYKDGGIENSMSFASGLLDMTMSVESAWTSSDQTLKGNAEHVPSGNFVEKFTDLLLSSSAGDRSFTEGGGESDNGGVITEPSGAAAAAASSGSHDDYFEDNKNYWNSILNLVNSSPSHSPMF